VVLIARAVLGVAGVALGCGVGAWWDLREWVGLRSRNSGSGLGVELG